MQVQDAVQYVGPTALVTLTGAVDRHDQNKRKVNLLVKYLRRTGVDVGLLWATERNPRGTGFHIHGWLRGALPPPGRVEGTARQVGFLDGHVKDVSFDGDYAYICKAATWNQASLASHRALNGTELVHGGRGFWRDPVTSKPLSRPVAATRQRARKRQLQTMAALPADRTRSAGQTAG